MNHTKGCLRVYNFFVAKMVQEKSKDTECKDEQTEWKDLIELKAFCDLCTA